MHISRAAIVRCCAVVAIAILEGCIPASISYLQIEAPSATHFKRTCSASAGAPVIAYYPFHGIFISIDPNPVFFVGLHVPSGSVVQLSDDTVKIVGSGAAGPVDLAIRLKISPHAVMGWNEPPAFRQLPDPFDSTSSTLGALPGSSANGYLRWYLFVGIQEHDSGQFVGPPPGLLEGTIELPAMTINGQLYPAQVLPFKRTSYATVMPVNC